jgi:Predicted ATP-dependent protease
MAGDLAVMEGSEYITGKHVEAAIKRAIPVEEQIIKNTKVMRTHSKRILQVPNTYANPKDTMKT